MDFTEGGTKKTGMGRHRLQRGAGRASQKSGRFDLYERREIDTILKQLKVNASGVVDDKTAAKWANRPASTTWSTGT